MSSVATPRGCRGESHGWQGRVWQGCAGLTCCEVRQAQTQAPAPLWLSGGRGQGRGQLALGHLRGLVAAPSQRCGGGDEVRVGMCR